MFSSDGGYRDVVKCQVQALLTSGLLMSGGMERSRLISSADFLNNNAKFVTLELHDGRTIQLSKASIVYLEEIDRTKTDQLSVNLVKTDLHNPFLILGLTPGATRKAVRQSYIELARQYHPDRFTSMNLPVEMQDYILAMTKRLNVAFNEANAIIQQKSAISAHARQQEEAVKEF